MKEVRAYEKNEGRRERERKKRGSIIDEMDVNRSETL